MVKIDRRDDFYLVEALARWHYEMSHLPRAINLPYEFVDEAEKELPDKRAQIGVYCMNEECEASREDARELEEMGYRHILHYAGGKPDRPGLARLQSLARQHRHPPAGSRHAHARRQRQPGVGASLPEQPH